MIGNSLRMGAGESAQFPTEVKDVLAMFAPFTKSDEDPNGMKFRCKFRVPKALT
jgi:hypothetical protein